MPAPMPSRSTMKLTLTIGMIPLALDVFSAIEESNVARSMYRKVGDTLHKVGMKKYDQITGDEITESEIIKCVETPEGELVEVSDDDMQALLSGENGSCQFIGFLKIDQFDYSTEKPYQVRPQKVKTRVNPYEKPFALILEAMRRRNSVALLSYVTRGKTRYAAIGADGSLVTLRFDEEVREARPMPEVALSDQELAMGEMVIDTFALTEAPVISDEDSAKVMEFAMEKAKTLAAGGTVTLPTAAVAPAAPADDLMALLAASIGQASQS